MTDNLFSDCYLWFSQVLGWVSDAWDLLTSPLREVVNFDISGGVPIIDALLGWIDEALQIFLESFVGDFSFITLVFGGGFSLIMIVNLARFFFK